MNQAVLQIPINKALGKKLLPSKVFRLCKRVVRVFLAKFAKNEIEFGFINPTLELSEKNDQRYAKIVNEYKLGKAKTKSFNRVDKLV